MSDCTARAQTNATGVLVGDPSAVTNASIWILSEPAKRHEWEGQISIKSLTSGRPMYSSTGVQFAIYDSLLLILS